MISTQINISSDILENGNEAVITIWFASDGVEVVSGKLIAEIMIEKAVEEIHAPATGTLRILKQVDDVINNGDVLGVIE